MLPRSLFSKLSSATLRRVEQRCLVQFSSHQDSVQIINHSDKKRRRYNRQSNSRYGRIAASVTGALLGAAIFTTDDADDDRTRRVRTLLSRLSVNAAEPVTGDNSKHGSSSSRRRQFNFIADLVEETAPGLVYIEIKDGGVRDYYTGQPITVSNGSGEY